MDTHKNARLTLKGREEMVRAVVDRGMSNAAGARQFNTTPKTVGKWVGRFCAEGLDGLRDRSSRPLSSPSQIPLATADTVEKLRRERAAPRSTSQPTLASPKPASRAFSNAAASAGSLASSCRSRIHGTSARNHARSSISILRSSAVSAAWATPNAGEAIAAVKVQAGIRPCRYRRPFAVNRHAKRTPFSG